MLKSLKYIVNPVTKPGMSKSFKITCAILIAVIVLAAVAAPILYFSKFHKDYINIFNTFNTQY